MPRPGRVAGAVEHGADGEFGCGQFDTSVQFAVSLGSHRGIRAQQQRTVASGPGPGQQVFGEGSVTPQVQLEPQRTAVRGIGDRGIPLSPESLVLPDYVDAIPPNFFDTAMRVLGLAHSVATAPASFDIDLAHRTNRGVVQQRAEELSEAGLRIRIGEASLTSIGDLYLDWLANGSEMPNAPLAGFGDILAGTDAGRDLEAAFAAASVGAVAVPGRGPGNTRSQAVRAQHLEDRLPHGRAPDALVRADEHEIHARRRCGRTRGQAQEALQPLAEVEGRHSVVDPQSRVIAPVAPASAQDRPSSRVAVPV